MNRISFIDTEIDRNSGKILLSFIYISMFLCRSFKTVFPIINQAWISNNI
jgi:hypothetical protein